MKRPFDAFCAAAQARRGDLFHAEGPITVAAAPGWVDLIGGTATDGGSLALGWPTGATALVALQPDPEPLIQLFVAEQYFQFPCAALVDATGWPCSFNELTKQLYSAPPELAELLGIWVALMREEFVRFPAGVRVWMQPAAGPGAAASVTAALAQALVTAFAVKLSARELALAVEVALAHSHGLGGAGTLGPMVSLCAPATHLLLLHQQPAWRWGDVHLPHGAAIWVLTVGAPVPQAPSPRLRTAARLAYAAIAAADGLTLQAADRQWQGYLANLAGTTFEQRYRAALPTTLRGKTIKPPDHQAMEIDPEAQYPLQAVAALAVGEHLRARMIVALLRGAASKPQRDDDLHLIGELLLQSHWAQHAAGFSDAHADALLELVVAQGVEHGLFGARMPAPATGATLVILGRTDADALVHTLADSYAQRVGLPVTVTSGSSPGASAVGARRLMP